MWKGRFQKETSDLVKRYGESVSFDWRLYAQDIRGSIAPAEALLRAKIITATERGTTHSHATAAPPMLPTHPVPHPHRCHPAAAGPPRPKMNTAHA